jgi:hypothetical protein
MFLSLFDRYISKAKKSTFRCPVLDTKMDALLLAFLLINLCACALSFGLAVYYQQGWWITPLKIIWKLLFLTSFLYTLLQISTPILADVWFTLALLFITTERFSAMSFFRGGEKWAMGQSFSLIFVIMLVSASGLVLAISFLDPGPVVNRLDPKLLGIAFPAFFNWMIIVFQIVIVYKLTQLRKQNPECLNLFTDLTWSELEGMSVIHPFTCSNTHVALLGRTVPFPILGRELESAENMSIALFPAAALLALFYSDRMASFLNNLPPIDVFVNDMKTSPLFTVFRCCMLLMPIYFYLVYFTFDSDFRYAFSRSSSSQTRQPQRSITFNQNGLNVDPNSRRLKHRRRPVFKTTAL